MELKFYGRIAYMEHRISTSQRVTQVATKNRKTVATTIKHSARYYYDGRIMTFHST
jgi:hypothetical protein